MTWRHRLTKDLKEINSLGCDQQILFLKISSKLFRHFGCYRQEGVKSLLVNKATWLVELAMCFFIGCIFVTRWYLALMLLVAYWANTKWCKKTEKMSETLAHSSESTHHAIQWIPTWQGLDNFQKSLHPSALGGSRISIGRFRRGNIIITVNRCRLVAYFREISTRGTWNAWHPFWLSAPEIARGGGGGGGTCKEVRYRAWAPTPVKLNCYALFLRNSSWLSCACALLCLSPLPTRIPQGYFFLWCEIGSPRQNSANNSASSNILPFDAYFKFYLKRYHRFSEDTVLGRKTLWHSQQSACCHLDTQTFKNPTLIHPLFLGWIFRNAS